MRDCAATQEVFAFVIGGHKPLNPAAACALGARIHEAPNNEAPDNED